MTDKPNNKSNEQNKYTLSNAPAFTGWRKNFLLLSRCAVYFKPYTPRILLAVFAMSMVALAEGAAAFLVKPALDDIFIEKDTFALFVLPIAYVAIIAGKGFFRFIQQYEMTYSGLMVLEKLRDNLYRKMVAMPMRFFEENQIGMLMSRIINDVSSIRTSIPALVMIVRQILTMIVLLGVLFYRDAYLAFWSVVVLPLAVYPFLYFARRLRKLSRKNQSTLADISSFLQEIFSGIRVVKSFSRETAEKERFDAENKRIVRITIKERIASELSSSTMEVIGAIAIGLIIWYGGKQVIDGVSTPGTFFSFMAALAMMYEPVKKLNMYNVEIVRALAGAERIFEVIDSPALKEEDQGTTEFHPPFEGISFEKVTFTYAGCPHPALDNINLQVRSGERIAIVGPSGSGKTTLVNLIPRFYSPDQGIIAINGRDIREYTLPSLRRGIGLVSQDAFLFNLSVAKNIAYSQDHIDMEAVQKAAEAAYSHEFITKLPNGYETVVGERGVMLSGGQKQRLTIARALLSDPPLLILDEATSALDSESEQIVQLALENLMRHRTSIVIAHRLSTVLSADRILVMDHGRILAEGNHELLLKNSPLYAKLYHMQFKNPQVPTLAEEQSDTVQA